MKGLDDGPDGLNEVAFERALRSSAKRRVRPARVIRTANERPTRPIAFDEDDAAAWMADTAWISEMRRWRP